MQDVVAVEVAHGGRDFEGGQQHVPEVHLPLGLPRSRLLAEPVPPDALLISKKRIDFYQEQPSGWVCRDRGAPGWIRKLLGCCLTDNARNVIRAAYTDGKAWGRWLLAFIREHGPSMLRSGGH